MAYLGKVVAFTVVIAVLLSSVNAIIQSDSTDASASTSYDAEVTPFTFPECEGIPILTALKEAEATIDVSIYLLSSSYALSLLLEKAEKGVQVRILLDGQPVAADIASYSETKLFKNIIDAGGDVNVINYKGCSTQTYSHLHNKYAVIDGKTVVISSENWTSGNFRYSDNGNIGWGAVIKSEGYAAYMKGIFETDFDESRSDVKDFNEVFPDIGTYPNPYYSIGTYETRTFSAKVTPAMAPDNAWDQLKSLMTSATQRLYSEQLDLSETYYTGADGPYQWVLERSEAGVDTRLVLNTSYDSEGKGQGDMVRDINETTKIIAAGSMDDGTRLIHNKGVVVDDKVWLGSMNWTPDSINDNREACVIIESADISEFYAESLLMHLYSSYVPGGDKQVSHITYDVDGNKTTLTYIKGDKVLLPDDPVKADVSVYTYTFSHWANYTDGMVADLDVTLTAVFDEHTIVEEYDWYLYAVGVLGVLAAVSLITWYVRNGRN